MKRKSVFRFAVPVAAIPVTAGLVMIPALREDLNLRRGAKSASTVTLPSGRVGLVSLPPQSPPATPMEFTQKGCPSNASSMLRNQTPVAPTDSIELDRIVAFSPTGPYQIRVFADGRVEREVPWCPLHPEDKIIYVDPKVAQELLIRARDGGFRQLCAFYTFVPRPGRSVDGTETALTLSIRGQSNRVHNCLGNPPAIYNELTDAIQKLSPMGKLATYSSFTSERKAECDAISARRLSQQSHK